MDEERYRVLFEDSPFPMWEEDFSEIKRYLDSLAAGGISDIPGYLAAHRSDVEECLRLVNVLDVNRAARDFYGASNKNELIVGLSRIFDEPAIEIFREEISRLFEGSTRFQAEFVVRTLKGEERLVDMIVSIVDSARQDWSRVIVSFFDITDRKRLEEQFVQSQKMESLGRLAGGVAHDFNNLLTIVNGYTDWILREMEPVHPFREKLAEVRGAGERCAELTRQLLAFSRKQIVRTGPLDLNTIIRESQGLLGRVLGDDIRIATDLAPDLGVIEADRGQMHQVLMNLALNARDAMPAGGTVTIETRNVSDSREILLEIRDTGYGIDESTRRHLFEPFFTTKKGSRNSGLGLAIVFGIVSHAGGRIEVSSQPGAGAEFRIYLPRVDKPVEAPCPPATRERGGAGAVLVVEDRADVRAMVCNMLEELGYQTLAADSGAGALLVAAAHPQPIPLLLTDVIMPGMNGSELAEQFRSISPRTKVIFMSGYTDEILTNTNSSDSGAPYLQKPFTMAQLAEMLRRVEDTNPN
jgi:PAS domain S-box-containing protein